MKIEIRKAKKEDLDSITALYTEYLSHTGPFAGFVNENKITINKKEVRDAIKKRFISSNKNIFLVAEKDKKLLGFVQAEIMSHQESRTKKRVIEIVDIYAKPKRKGIGRRLFNEIEKWANSNKAKFILWEFIFGNKIAEKFCIKNKFKPFKIKMLKKLK